MRPSNPVFISLGSNILPHQNIQQALATLSSELTDCKTSGIYQSAAVGMQGADFLNAVVAGYTDESPSDVVARLLAIEHEHGRVRSTNKFTDRPLDLDLLLYADLVTDKLPHHDITEQAYVLQPLTELAPDLIHPVVGVSMLKLQSELQRCHPEKFENLVPVSINSID